MDTDKIFSELCEMVRLDFNDYAPKLRRYERKLQKEIKETPKNIRAVCLLAMIKCELRQKTATSVKYLVQAYDNFQDTLDDREFSLLATNLAYFYIEECANKETLTQSLLHSAIRRNSPFSETYYALALIHYKAEQFELALHFCKKAAEITPLFRYWYNYAICLYKTCNFEESYAELRRLSEGYATHTYRARAYYDCAAVCLSLGKTEEAMKIADDLLRIDYLDLDIESYWLADLMFLLGRYEDCIALYDSERLMETADWLGVYYYCLKSLGRADEASMKFRKTIDALQNNMDEQTLDDFDGDREDYDYFLNSEKERIRLIQSAYNNVFERNIKPDVELYVDLLYGCYYIECPRHSHDDMQKVLAL